MSRGERWLDVFSTATELLPHALTVVDMGVPGLPMVFVNAAWEKLTGYSRAEALGQNCRMLQGAGTEQAAVAHLVESIRERRSCVVTLTNYTKAGLPFQHQVRDPCH